MVSAEQHDAHGPANGVGREGSAFGIFEHELQLLLQLVRSSILAVFRKGEQGLLGVIVRRLDGLCDLARVGLDEGTRCHTNGFRAPESRGEHEPGRMIEGLFEIGHGRDVVEDGRDVVKQGDVLVKMNPLNTEADLTGIELQYINLLATESRLISERLGQTEITWRPAFQRLATRSPLVDPEFSRVVFDVQWALMTGVAAALFNPLADAAISVRVAHPHDFLGEPRFRVTSDACTSTTFPHAQVARQNIFPPRLPDGLCSVNRPETKPVKSRAR